MKMKLVGRLVVQVPEPVARNKNYVDAVDLAKDYNFWKKVYEVESEGWYTEWQRAFLKRILEFLDDWEYLSWKQYQAIFKIRPVEDAPVVQSRKVSLGSNIYYEEAIGFLPGEFQNMQRTLDLVRRNIDSRHPEEAAALFEHQNNFLGSTGYTPSLSDCEADSGDGEIVNLVYNKYNYEY